MASSVMMMDTLANYGQALALRPRDVGALTNRGISPSNWVDLRNQLKDAERVIAIDPEHPGGYLARAKASQGSPSYTCHEPGAQFELCCKPDAEASIQYHLLRSLGKIVQRGWCRINDRICFVTIKRIRFVMAGFFLEGCHLV